MEDQRFQGRFQWNVNPDEYDYIRSLWLTHVTAEEKLFVDHTEAEGKRNLDIVINTLTDDCIFELGQTGEKWTGLEGAREFYDTFLAAFSGMRWVPQAIVIGPQGVLDVANMTGVLNALFAGLTQTGKQVRLQWIIYFPWNREAKKFEGEIVYSIRPLFK